MPKSSNQKLKLLYLLKMFLEETDENNSLTMSEIILKLKELGINAERKSLYDDFEQLNIFGLDICKTSEKVPGYYNLATQFELPELKLLIDAVQSSKFVTEKKSLELISKIEKLTSRHNAGKLRRQVYIANRVKTRNEKVFYNVDKIYDAIGENKRISFKYFNYTIEKEKLYRKDGREYEESPVTLMWDDENYYLVAYNSKHSNYVHYRVDRMENIEILADERCIPDKPFDTAHYAKKVFSMFLGEETLVTMRFENSLINVAFDRFGMDVTPFKDGDNHFIIKTGVSVSQQFFGWIASLGARAEIVSPENVREDFVSMMNDVLKIHK